MREKAGRTKYNIPEGTASKIEYWGGRNRKLYQKICKNIECEKEFWVPAHFYLRQDCCSKFCGHRHRWAENRVIVNCAYCEKEIEKSKSRLKYTKSGLLFCDRRCKELMTTEQGKYFTGLVAYRDKIELNKCFDCGWNTLPEVLQVHHLDRNRENNEETNLVALCPTCHMVLHYIEATGLYSTKNKRKG